MPLIEPPLYAPRWDKNFFWAHQTNNAGFLSLGCSQSASGTFSNLTTTETEGIVLNVASSGAANNTIGESSGTANFLRGTTTTGFGGFSSYQRSYFPDASYGNTGIGTGARIFVGFSSIQGRNSVSSDDPASQRCGFSYLSSSTISPDSTWYFSSKDGTTEARINTNLGFTPQHTYDFYIKCEPMGEIILWEIIDITTGETQTGAAKNSIPDADTRLYYAGYMASINAVVRNMGFRQIYVECGK